jgi:hypothetical protein
MDGASSDSLRDVSRFSDVVMKNYSTVVEMNLTDLARDERSPFLLLDNVIFPLL